MSDEKFSQDGWSYRPNKYGFVPYQWDALTPEKRAVIAEAYARTAVWKPKEKP